MIPSDSLAVYTKNAYDPTKTFLLASQVGVVDVILKVLKEEFSPGHLLYAKNEEGCDALYLAASNGHADCVLALLQAGADADQLSEAKQKSILMGLADTVNPGDVFALLMKTGIDVNAQDRSSWTALHWAVERKNTVLVKLLLQAGADPRIVEQNGYTPLHLASSNAVWSGLDIPLIQALLAWKSPHLMSLLQQKTFCGQTALELAKDMALQSVLRGALEHKELHQMAAVTSCRQIKRL